MIKFKIKGEPDVVEVPTNQALVEYMNETARFGSATAEDYMREYARRAVISRDVDIRATDFDSFVEDLVGFGDIILIRDGEQFYNHLRQQLQENQLLHPEKGYTFSQWLNDADLQFTIPRNNSKAIPMHLIINAKDDHNLGININEQWFKGHGCNRGWCLPIVLNKLFETYPG